jgi:O-antigen/teichoic acid export membrane protein
VRETTDHRRTSTLALVGVKWVGLGLVLQKLLQVGTIVVLARLLSPEDFGLVAATALALTVTIALKEMGMPTALVQRRSRVKAAADGLFLTSCATSILLYGLITAMAPALSAFFQNDLVGPVFRVMGLQLFTESIILVPRALAARELRLRLQVVLALAESAAAAAVSLLLVFEDFGVWAMVYGALAGWIVHAILWWVVTDWRPTGRFDLRVLREMIAFGARISVAAGVTDGVDALARAFVGRWQGVASLGLYDLAMRMVNLPVRQVAANLMLRVAIPAFSRVQADLERVRGWYVQTLRYLALAMTPIAVTLLVLPDHLVPIIFGERWAPSAPLLAILAPVVLFAPLGDGRAVFVSLGRADLMLRLALGRLVVALPLMVLAASVDVAAVCAVYTGTALGVAVASLVLVVRLVGIPLQRVLAETVVPLVAGCSLAVTLFIARVVASRFLDGPTIATLAATLCVGALVYLGVVWWCRPVLVGELVGMILRSLGLETSARTSMPGTGDVVSDLRDGARAPVTGGDPGDPAAPGRGES